jgi:hypothetical protein
MSMPLPGYFHNLLEFIHIDAGVRIVGHVIEDVGKDGEGRVLALMVPADPINEGRQGADAGCLTLRGLLEQRIGRDAGGTSFVQRFIVGLPGAGQELCHELFLVIKLLPELSTVEIQLVTQLQD